MNANVHQALSKKFEASRIVFWNDVKCELRSDFEAMELAGVEKIELQSNEFGVKYRLLREGGEIKDTHSLCAPTSAERHNNYTRLIHNKRTL